MRHNHYLQLRLAIRGGQKIGKEDPRGLQLEILRDLRASIDADLRGEGRERSLRESEERDDQKLHGYWAGLRGTQACGSRPEHGDSRFGNVHEAGDRVPEEEGCTSADSRESRGIICGGEEDRRGEEGGGESS